MMALSVSMYSSVGRAISRIRSWKSSIRTFVHCRSMKPTIRGVSISTSLHGLRTR